MEGTDLKRVMHMLRSERMEEKFRLLGAGTLLSELRSAVSLVHTDATVSKEVSLRLMFRVRSLATPLRELLEAVLHAQIKAEQWHQAPAALFRYLAFRSVTLRELTQFLHKFSSLSSYLREELTPHLLRHGSGAGSSSGSGGARLPSRDSVQLPMVGRTDLLDKMVSILIADRTGDAGAGLLVITIAGGPGVGKTRLADAILRDGRVRHKFHTRLRVPVTQKFNLRNIKATMFHTRSLEEVLHMLEDERSYIASKLSGGDYLFVLDDVWSDNEGKWLAIADLMTALPPSGRVVVTTRTPDIAPKLATIVETATASRTLYLQPLEQEFSYAFAARWIAAYHSDWPPELITEAGMTIADKCGGVPLLLDYVCRFFCQPLHMPFWQEFLENTGNKVHPDIVFWEGLLSCIDDLPHDLFWRRFLGHYPGIHGDNAVFQSAIASYNHLPSDLRMCLLYCSMFPSDYAFDAEELADLLAAQGHIPTIVAKAQRKGFLKQLLEECFYPLQQHEYGDNTTYRMHQVMYIFVQTEDRRSGSVFRVDQATQHATEVTDQSSIRIRRASLILNPLTASFPRRICTFNNLGALILLQQGAMYPTDQPRCEITEIPHHFGPRLHTLSFRATKIRMLPTKFMERYHKMKYLNLSQTDIKNIPSTISRLQLLQTLILSHCGKLEKLHRNTVKLASLQKLDLQGCCNLVDLPPEMSRLRSLEYLNFTGCSSLAQMPRGMGQLKSLQILLGYIVSSTDGSSLSELQSLANLHRLSLQSVEKVPDLSDVRYARLQHKTRLESLSLQWNMDDFSSTETAYEVLESVQPHRRLKALEIVAYPGKKLPSWITMPTTTWIATTEPYLKALVEIKLINIRSCELPPLGLLPCLKIAEISGVETICDVGDNFYGHNGTFPSLERLTFSYMHNLEVWEQAHRADMFPRLAELTVIQCPKLRALHTELPSVEKLTLWMDNKVLNGVKGAMRGVTTNLQHVSVSFSEGLTDSSGCEGLQDVGKLTKLEICGCDELTCLPQGLQHLSSIKSLTIDNCRKLEILPDWLENLPSLQMMRLSGCPLLHYIPGGLEQRLGVIIYVEDCPNLVQEQPNFPSQSSGNLVGTKGKEIIIQDT